MKFNTVLGSGIISYTGLALEMKSDHIIYNNRSFCHYMNILLCIKHAAVNQVSCCTCLHGLFLIKIFLLQHAIELLYRPFDSIYSILHGISVACFY